MWELELYYHFYGPREPHAQRFEGIEDYQADDWARPRRAAAGQRERAPRARELAGAVWDGCARKGSKKARNWPHKKRERPPGAPDIRQATRREVRSAERLRQNQDAIA